MAPFPAGWPRSRASPTTPRPGARAHRAANPDSAPAPAAVPPGTRVYAVGDVHGQAPALSRLLDRIREDAQDAAHKRRVLVLLGDYVDRGPDSRGVVELLLNNPVPGFETRFLRGNHDAWLLAFLVESSLGFDWLNAGGQATLLSYGARVPRGPRTLAWLASLRDEFERLLPVPHRDFLESLLPYHIEGDYAFVHAGVRPGVPIDQQQEVDLLWIREDFLSTSHDHGRIIVHGHTVVDEPEVRPNRIGIDTGAYATGRLTCLVLEGVARRFLTAA